jgi:hypothetical protein
VGMVALGNAVPFVGPLIVDDQKISVLPSLWPMPANSPGRFSIAGGWAEPSFDHSRVLHRRCVAQLF